MTLTAVVALTIALQTASSPPPTPSKPASIDQEVVVTGRTDQAKEVKRFVDALTYSPSTLSQLSRFERVKVCPAAAGLTPAGVTTVVTRMRRIATAAGVGVGAEDCRPNILVVVTRGKAIFVRSLLKRYPKLLPDLTPKQLQGYLDDRTPVAAWQIAGAPVSGDGAEVVQFSTDLNPENRSTRDAGRIRPRVRPQFAGAIVVVEASALEGLTTIQLADYATMRSLASTDPARLPKDGYAPTILKVIDAPMGSAVPETLTKWDLAFLKATYSAEQGLYAPAQRGSIKQAVNEALQEE